MITSSFYLVLKILFILCLLKQAIVDWKVRSACAYIETIKCCKSNWVVLLQTGAEQYYETAQILIHNNLFQLIKLTQKQKNQYVILFNDQLSSDELRLLHLKTMMLKSEKSKSSKIPKVHE